MTAIPVIEPRLLYAQVGPQVEMLIALFPESDDPQKERVRKAIVEFNEALKEWAEHAR